MKALAAVLAAAVLAVSCGGSGGDSDSDAADGNGRSGSADAAESREDEFGRAIPEGQDWNADGRPEEAGGLGANTPSVEQILAGREGLPYGCRGDEDDEGTKPGDVAPLGGDRKDDFPMTVVMTPVTGERGTPIRIDTTVVTRERTLVIVLASFHDEDAHGLKASKFADATGRAVFEGKVPADAPPGWGIITVTAQTRDGKVAISRNEFIVTGPGCDSSAFED